MNFCIIVPVYNEEAYLEKCLHSFVKQTLLPKRIMIVNDGSTDNTQKIIDSFTETYSFIKGIHLTTQSTHEPGPKVINAFYKGFEMLEEEFDFIGKFDADIILPPNYFEKIFELFTSDQKIGIAGGNLYVEKENIWEYENISEKTKVRGPIKLYRKQCLEDIGGLKKSIGWDTIDELLAQYRGWKIKTDTALHVKHLKPTGQVYNKAARHKQGEAFYKMRYGFLLTAIAAAKLAVGKGSFQFFMDSVKGFLDSKKSNLEFAVSTTEGEFIRKHRWQGIRRKLGFKIAD